MLNWLRQSRRQRYLGKPLPADWQAWLRTNVVHYQLLSDGERAVLDADTQVFVADKFWEGCRGLVATEEMKVTIAAQACLMLLGLEHDYFSRVYTILIYPSGFMIPESDDYESGEIVDEDETAAIDGLSPPRGPIALAWDSVLAEGRNPSMGHNLVIHEFAHQLEDDQGRGDLGLEDLDPELDVRWRNVRNREYRQLLRQVKQGEESLLGEDAAISKSEFFAVASERFFTVPQQLQRQHRELYELLSKYYRVDPLAWFRDYE